MIKIINEDINDDDINYGLDYGDIVYVDKQFTLDFPHSPTTYQILEKEGRPFMVSDVVEDEEGFVKSATLCPISSTITQRDRQSGTNYFIKDLKSCGLSRESMIELSQQIKDVPIEYIKVPNKTLPQNEYRDVWKLKAMLKNSNEMGLFTSVKR